MPPNEPDPPWPARTRMSKTCGAPPSSGGRRLSSLRRWRIRMLALWREELTDTVLEPPAPPCSRPLQTLVPTTDPRGERAADGAAPGGDPDDGALVQAILQGDERARGELVERLRCVPRFLANLNAQYGSLFQEDDLADLVQQTMLVVLGKLPGFRGPGSLRAWAYGIAQREYLYARRTRLRRASRQRSLGEDIDPPQPVEEVAQDEYHAVWALGELEPEEREVLSLRLFDELEYAEIGRRFGMPENTAKTRFHRALQHLRELIAISRSREEHRA